MDRPGAAPYLPATVRWAAERFGDRPAFVDPDGSILSYRDLLVRSRAVAAGLRSVGVGEGRWSR